jgi:hypothetical protein
MDERNVVWGLTALLGAALAYVDWSKLRRPWLGLGIVAAMLGGYVTTVASPFTFGGDSYYMQGVLVSAFAALAAAGYIGCCALWAARLGVARLRKARSS